MLTIDYDLLDLRPGMTVLDLGCGEGRHAFEAYRRAREGWGGFFERIAERLASDESGAAEPS